MENLFLFVAKGLGIAPTFFPKNYQQDFGQKRQRRSVSLRGIFSQEKGGRKRLFTFRIPSAASAWRPWLRFRLRPRFGARQTRSWAASDLKAPAYFSY